MTVLRYIDRYEILEELGRGGMAIVYLARQRDLDRLVALKELSAFHRTDAAWDSRFLRESRLAGSLAHANIVTVHDYLRVEGTPYISMEYMERGSLRPYVSTLTLPQVGAVLADLLSGLEYAERRGIVHRDLKPENLLVTGEGRVKIADFGIAKATSQLNAGTVQTAAGVAVGTPGYMAPEQAMARNVGPWSDLYSVGCIAYELCVGRLPFNEPEPFALMLRHINEPIEPAARVNPSLDPRLGAWIDRLLAKPPTERPASAGEAWESLEEILLTLLGPRWRREGELPELGDEPSAPAHTPPSSAVLNPSDFVDYEPRVPGPYTPPPDEPVPDSLVRTAAALVPEPLVLAPTDVATPPPFEFVTVEPVVPPPTVVETAPAARRSRAPLWIGAAVAAAAGGAFLLFTGDDAPTESAVRAAATSVSTVRASPPNPQEVTGGGLSLTLPKGWKHRTAPAEDYGLPSAVFAGPRDDVIAGVLPVDNMGKVISQDGLRPGDPWTIGLGGHQVSRYTAKRPDRTIFILPGDRAVATVICAPETAACREVVGSVAVPGSEFYPDAPSDTYAKKVNDILKDVNGATSTGMRAMRRANRASVQAGAAQDLSTRFRRKSTDLTGVVLSPKDQLLNSPFSLALRDTADEYAKLASAARKNDRGAYKRASNRVAAARKRVNTALAGFAKDGYKDLGKLNTARIPALKRKKQTTTRHTGTTPSSPTPVATPTPQPTTNNTTQQQQTVQPQPTPRPQSTPKPTPVPALPTPVPIDG